LRERFTNRRFARKSLTVMLNRKERSCVVGEASHQFVQL
jgi:hypothetical protein